MFFLLYLFPFFCYFSISSHSLFILFSLSFSSLSLFKPRLCFSPLHSLSLFLSISPLSLSSFCQLLSLGYEIIEWSMLMKHKRIIAEPEVKINEINGENK